MNFENMRVKQIQTFVSYKPNITSWRAENRRNHIIGINITGAADHDLGYKHLDLKPDHIYFFNQKDDFDAFVSEAGYCYSIHFTTYEPIETESFCKKVKNTDEIVKWIRRIESAWLKRPNGELEMLSEFYALCHSFYQTYRAAYTPKDQRMITAKEYLDLHFKEKDCLANAAERCGITQRRFRDLFKQNFDTTPGSYVLFKKLRYAKKLLELGYLSVTEVSEMAGFSDVYHFSKTFRREAGCPPGEFKKIGLQKNGTMSGDVSVANQSEP